MRIPEEMMSSDDAQFVLETLNEQLKNYEDRLDYLRAQLKIVNRNIKSCMDNIEKVDTSKRLHRDSPKKWRLENAIKHIMRSNAKKLERKHIRSLLSGHINDIFTESQFNSHISHMVKKKILNVEHDYKAIPFRVYYTLADMDM